MVPKTADAVIIGAGVIGASIAYHLTRHGIQPLRARKKRSGRRQLGGLRRARVHAVEETRSAPEARPGKPQAFRRPGRYRLGSSIEFKNPGGMCLIESEAELAAMRLFVAEQRTSGLDVELIDGDEARRREPCLSEKVIAATYSALDSQVNPYALTFAFLRAAKSAGARILTGENVQGVEVMAGKNPGGHY